MTLVSAPLTNNAYGFPRGQRRRIRPFILMCVHITGNGRTAAATDLHAAAMGERSYANRAGSTGPSATGYVARDGWAVLAVDPDRYAAWSNGDVSAPHTSNPGIARVLALRAKGYNANEAYWEEWEALGFGTTFRITSSQMTFLADRIATRSLATGIPISRETVHGHWEINGVDRRNCPAPYAERETFLNNLIALARTAAGQGLPRPEEPPVEQFNIPPAPTDLVLGAGAVLYTSHPVVEQDNRRVVVGAPPPLPRVVPLYGVFPDGVQIVGYQPDGATVPHSYFVKKGVGTRVERDEVDVAAVVNAALDKVTASAIPGAEAAIAAAVRSARPAA